MATIQDIVTGALQKLGQVHANESPSATDSAYMLNELNGMMKALEGRAVYVGWTDKILTDDFPLDGKHEDGIKAMLAVQGTNPFGGDELISRVTRGQAKMGFARLFGDFHNAEIMGVDPYLSDMPSERLFVTGDATEV